MTVPFGEIKEISKSAFQVCVIFTLTEAICAAVAHVVGTARDEETPVVLLSGIAALGEFVNEIAAMSVLFPEDIKFTEPAAQIVEALEEAETPVGLGLTISVFDADAVPQEPPLEVNVKVTVPV